MAIGENIKKFRKAAGLTQKQLSEKIGKGFSTVQKYELGIFTPSIAVVKEISTVLNVSVNELIDEDNIISFYGKKGSHIAELDRMLHKALDELTPDDRIRLLHPFINTIGYLTGIDPERKRGEAIDRLREIIGSFGEMILNSWEMVFASINNPNDYKLFCQNYKNGIKQFESHRAALIETALQRFDDNANLSALIYGKEAAQNGEHNEKVE